jgi:hypothetical protein
VPVLKALMEDLHVQPVMHLLSSARLVNVSYVIQVVKHVEMYLKIVQHAQTEKCSYQE